MTSRSINFHSSRLIRILTDMAIVDAVEPGSSFAEKLGLWLDHHDAITLRAALNAGTSSPPVMRSGSQSVVAVAIGDEVAQVRAALVNSITRNGTPSVGRTGIELPTPGESMSTVRSYEPYRRYYLAHQRDMELSVRPLRSHVREVMARVSPALSKLAALDAVFDGILSDRESKLLSTVPFVLERRFVQLLKAHQHMLIEAQQADSPDVWMKAQGWLARFCNELQMVLLAELDVRLQPTVGLIEAFNNQTTQSQ